MNCPECTTIVNETKGSPVRPYLTFTNVPSVAGSNFGAERRAAMVTCNNWRLATHRRYATTVSSAVGPGREPGSTRGEKRNPPSGAPGTSWRPPVNCSWRPGTVPLGLEHGAC